MLPHVQVLSKSLQHKFSLLMRHHRSLNFIEKHPAASSSTKDARQEAEVPYH